MDPHVKIELRPLMAVARSQLVVWEDMYIREFLFLNCGEGYVDTFSKAEHILNQEQISTYQASN
jgi:hypothetical protein